MPKNKTQKNIPKGWQETKLVDIGIFSKGSGISKPELSNRGYNAVRYGEIYTRHNVCIKKIHSFISSEIVKNTRKIKYGDILFAGSGETIDEIGKSVTYLKKDICYAGGDIIIFSPKKQNSLFLSFLLNSKITRKDLRKLGQGQSVVHIYKKDLEKLNLFLPPLPEQNRIVAILETWDEYLEKLSRKIEIKKNIKKGLMALMMNCELLIVNGKEVCAPKLRLPEFSGEWESVKLGDVCKRIRTGKLDANAMVENGKYRFYTCAKDFYKINEHAFNTEALLISGNGANVGYIHYYKGKFNAYQRTYILDKFKSNIFFIRYILDKFLKQRIFAEKCDGNTPYIKMDTLTDMKIKIPKDTKEQTAIAEILTTADEEIEALEEKKKIIEEQKRFLLNNLVTGRIQV